MTLNYKRQEADDTCRNYFGYGLRSNIVPTTAKSLWHTLKKAAGQIDLYVNADKRRKCVLIKKETSPQ